MAQGSFKTQDFGRTVVWQFPELSANIDEWTGLVHLQMMEFRLFSEKHAASGNTDVLEKCTSLLHRALIDGDAELKNAVYVSFLENIDPSQETGRKIFDSLSPELRNGWKDVRDYLDQLMKGPDPANSDQQS